MNLIMEMRQGFLPVSTIVNNSSAHRHERVIVVTLSAVLSFSMGFQKWLIFNPLNRYCLEVNQK